MHRSMRKLPYLGHDDGDDEEIDEECIGHLAVVVVKVEHRERDHQELLGCVGEGKS